MLEGVILQAIHFPTLLDNFLPLFFLKPLHLCFHSQFQQMALLPTSLFWVFEVAATNYHKSGGLKYSNLFFHSSRDQKSEIKVSVEPHSLQRLQRELLLTSSSSGSSRSSLACIWKLQFLPQSRHVVFSVLCSLFCCLSPGLYCDKIHISHKNRRWQKTSKFLLGGQHYPNSKTR